MASEVTFNIDGLDALYKQLQELPLRVEKNIMRGAVRAGATVYRDRARELAPKVSGALRKSIKTSSTKIRKGEAKVTVTAGAFYAHMVEFGTASYYEGKGKTVGKPYKIPKLTKNKKRTGKKAIAFGDVVVSAGVHPGIRPEPFMRPAFDRSTADVIEATRKYISDRLAKEALKA